MPLGQVNSRARDAGIGASTRRRASTARRTRQPARKRGRGSSYKDTKLIKRGRNHKKWPILCPIKLGDTMGPLFAGRAYNKWSWCVCPNLLGHSIGHLL